MVKNCERCRIPLSYDPNNGVQMMAFIDGQIHPVQSFIGGQWLGIGRDAKDIHSAIDGRVIAQAGNSGIDFGATLDYARSKGSPALAKMTFHDRAKMLKALALHISKHKQLLYDLSFATGATQKDHLIDIDGGIGTLLVFASKGRREMPDSTVYVDGQLEQLSRTGSFMGQHVCTPLQGVAIHINAFNFPVWGMLEKLAPTLLAGVPAIVKPATSTSYVAEACMRIMQDSSLLPAGAVQFISGSVGNLLDELGSQDVLSFTGSFSTGNQLRSHPNLLKHSTRVVVEQDSLNSTVLGPDVQPGSPELALFATEVVQEMTAKAGQKCTAIRRILVPASHTDAVIEALQRKLGSVRVGDPRLEDTDMGALVSAAQRQDVASIQEKLASETEVVFGDTGPLSMSGDGLSPNAFMSPILNYCASPDNAIHVHDLEAFGPVATVMPYNDLPQAIELLNRGQGSLVASVITRDVDVAKDMVMGSGAYHGRLYFNNQDSAKESTGHGSPLPHMTHGGPGRAGGGEEMGGVRGVMHYMQRTAIQGSPELLTGITGRWVPGATEHKKPNHPFTHRYHELTIGDTLNTASREVTLNDIEHFAEFTGDTFYAHMNHEAATRNPFFPGRVAHGYLLLSFAAGLFVEPAEGPVLANTGLDNLRFLKPVEPGDSVQVQLTVKHKTPRNDEYGEVRWHVTLTNQNDEPVAEYELLTMVAF